VDYLEVTTVQTLSALIVEVIKLDLSRAREVRAIDHRGLEETVMAVVIP
jgi:hypothetical protein